MSDTVQSHCIHRNIRFLEVIHCDFFVAEGKVRRTWAAFFRRQMIPVEIEGSRGVLEMFLSMFPASEFLNLLILLSRLVIICRRARWNACLLLELV